MAKWLDGEGTNKDTVISSRIRLARNIENTKFIEMLDKEEAQRIIEEVKNAIIHSNTILSKEFEFYKLNQMEPVDRQILVEKHLISQGLLENIESSAFLLRNDEKSTIMINEEDHIRMQVLLPGLNLEEGWDLCSKLDDILEENIKYAFDEKIGYLTSCPTNVGTGMRASVMVHLPCLVLTKQINAVLQAVNQIGLVVRGLYGEGTNAMGNIFQISNQTTLGETEEDIIKKLKNIVLQIIDKERISREKILNSKSIEIEDRVFRSLGLLRSARIISTKESMKLLSDVRMGIQMNIIDDIDDIIINNLMISTQPAGIQKRTNQNLSSHNRDIRRAEIIRKELND